MDWRNHEYYPDPTAAQALANVAREEKTFCVFICSPYAGDVDLNVEKAKEYLEFSIERGTIPFAPHLLYPQVFDDKDPRERKLALSLGMAWLERCDEVWVFGSIISKGMQREIRKAMKLEIPIRHFTEECEEVQCL